MLGRLPAHSVLPPGDLAPTIVARRLDQHARQRFYRPLPYVVWTADMRLAAELRPVFARICELAEASAKASARLLQPQSVAGVLLRPRLVSPHWPISRGLARELVGGDADAACLGPRAAGGRTAGRCADPGAADQAPVHTAGSGTKKLPEIRGYGTRTAEETDATGCWTRRLVAGSHSRAVPSPLAVASRRPSGLNATPRTQSVWPVRVWARCDGETGAGAGWDGRVRAARVSWESG
jgi:hypothetical protein